MSRRDLHIICGKCGTTPEDMEFKIAETPHDELEGVMRKLVYITCNNCGNLSELSEHMDERGSE